MVTLKNRFRGVRQNLKKARTYWSLRVWDKFSRKSKSKFYIHENKKKYNAPPSKKAREQTGKQEK